jgi:lysyl endopeptidase
MNLFRPVLLTLALAFAGTVAASDQPTLAVGGESSRAAKAETVVQWRQATPAGVARMAFGDLDLTRIAELQKRNERPHIATQIGINRAATEAARALPALRWETVAGGKVARLEIASPDALGLRVGLKVNGLPDGAEMRFAGSLAPDRLVLATAEQIRFQGAAGSRTYWTPVTDGDTQTIELFVPGRTDVSKLSLGVVAISHLLTNSIEQFSLAKAIGDSGSCNVDTVCRVAALGQPFVNTKNAVARMVFTDGGTYTCTGTLLNDTVTATQVPYFYTADHCISNATVAATLNTYWGFEATTCGGSTAATTTQRTGGADYLYSESEATGTDAALLRLKDVPPAGAYFNGWNAAALATGASLLAVHHPQSDLKKSSLGQKMGQDADYHTAAWTSGTTEGGSSGSGLFVLNGANYELRGGLYGGDATCANSGNVNTAGNRDYYSRLDVVYPHLAQWLAPTTNPNPGPTRAYTGAWYVPAESGWGLTATQFDNANQTLFILFFIYDANGVAKWYELGGGWSANDVRSGDVVQSNANQPWSTSFNPALRTFTTVGTATLTFTSATSATMTLTVNGVTRNVTLQKL